MNPKYKLKRIIVISGPPVTGKTLLANLIMENYHPMSVERNTFFSNAEMIVALMKKRIGNKVEVIHFDEVDGYADFEKAINLLDQIPANNIVPQLIFTGQYRHDVPDSLKEYVYQFHLTKRH